MTENTHDKSTLLVIVPGSSTTRDSKFYLLVAETGEFLASHFCSHAGCAKGDLFDKRPDSIKAWTERFGKIEVKFIDEVGISEHEIQLRNCIYSITTR